VGPPNSCGRFLRAETVQAESREPLNPLSCHQVISHQSVSLSVSQLSVDCRPFERLSRRCCLPLSPRLLVAWTGGTSHVPRSAFCCYSCTSAIPSRTHTVLFPSTSLQRRRVYCIPTKYAERSYILQKLILSMVRLTTGGRVQPSTLKPQNKATGQLTRRLAACCRNTDGPSRRPLTGSMHNQQS
jgi:hypothetical protein